MDEFVHVKIRIFKPGESRARCSGIRTLYISSKLLCTCENTHLKSGRVTSEVLGDAQIIFTCHVQMYVCVCGGVRAHASVCM